MLGKLYSVCTRRKLKVNAEKSKVMVFERREVEVINFNTHYRVSVPAVGRCKVVLGGKTMKEVKESKYLATVLCKHGETEGKIRESCGRQVCHRITCKDYERKECVHGDKKRIKEQYSPANTDIWITHLYME